MRLNFWDFFVILAYIVLVVAIGFYFKRKAQRSEKDYMLGGNTLPWYMLGISNASGMFDISGTMWLVTIGFVYGLKSVWIPWLWPTFNQIFLMVYLSAWLRRSNVITGAAWISTRFGRGQGASLSHKIVVVYAIISCLGFLAYGFVGLGKFVEIFIPWEWVCGLMHLNPAIISAEYVPHLYGLVFCIFATIYAITGGMSSIVWADLFHYVMMTMASIAIAIIAMVALSHNSLVVPNGWMSPFFGQHLNLDWSNIIPEVNHKIQEDGFSLFTIFFMMMLFKGLLVSAAGPAPNYDMQKILATKNPVEASKMSGVVSVILNPVRYLMITGFVVLGLLYYKKLNLMVGGHLDFEQILPSAINEFVPAGLLGLLLAGLIGAFMSTFAGTLNAAQAYVVNDIYLKIKKDPKPAAQRRTTYLVGVLILAVSLVIGLYAKNVNNLLQWIVSSLWGSYIAANVLKWYWWRFNGHGYFWGMLTGLIPALIFPQIFKGTLDLYFFPLILLISIVGAVAGTLLSKPTDMETLKNFYKQVRPWGFWGPIHRLVVADDPSFERNENFKRDMFNIFVGIIWQLCIVILPVYFVLMQWTQAAVVAAVVAVTSIILKKTWWDKLTN
jgi:solute:Na+ symporter, SSS family